MTDAPSTTSNTSQAMDPKISPTDKFASVRNNAGEMSPPPSKNTSAKEKEDFGPPGSSWDNKKFQEEYDRAFGSLLDQKFTMG